MNNASKFNIFLLLVFVSVLRAAVVKHKKGQPLNMRRTTTPPPSDRPGTVVKNPKIHKLKPSGPSMLVTFDGIGESCRSQAVSSLATDRSTVLAALKTKLEEKMAASQNEVVKLLSEYSSNSSITYTQNWLTNTILIHNFDEDLRKRITEIPNVRDIITQAMVRSSSSYSIGGYFTKDPVSAYIDGKPQPNLKQIKVPEAWEDLNGQKGDGITAGVIDIRGVHHTHDVIKDSWLGQYGWYDPAFCELEPDGDNPDMDNRNACYVYAFIAGSNGTGVAPNAKWMSCRISAKPGENLINFADLLKCDQFMICPTLADGSSPDCGKAPQVIYNLWFSEYVYRFKNDSPLVKIINSVIDCWSYAGMIPVFDSTETNYPKCGQGYWPSHSSRVISVGNFDNKGQVREYSRICPGVEGDIKPDICAPGNDLVDAIHTDNEGWTRFEASSGISSAHVVGAIALLLNKYKDLNFQQVKIMLQQSADKIPQSQVDEGYENCGNISLENFPNNLVGYGVLNVQSLLAMEPPEL